ncbi:viral A-type inclusion protein [Arundinibacter roseus]|uniref:Viral A-type inclusion protein n=1 Tax=Arundinibacter roseus TaxID=2070510 RepID=A0A4R4K7C2_9BACT|nr:viral A-type inclusion protein [Arundinibacter roseus]TDB63484.1 viral A-type inclusion protein [Arundinibacter roseus]
MIYRNTILLLPILLLGACTNTEKQQVETLEKQVMMIHDAVMPKMGELMRLHKKTSQKVAEMDSLLLLTPADSALTATRTQALELSLQLKKADEGMMGWMHQYRADSLKALPTPQAIEAYTKEKEKIENVSEQMLKSIAEAKAFVEK